MVLKGVLWLQEPGHCTTCYNTHYFVNIPLFSKILLWYLSKVHNAVLKSVYYIQAAAEKTAKQLQQQLSELHSKCDETNRTLSDFDAAKKKLAAENGDVLRQLEEAESTIGQLSKIKLSLTNQLEDNRKFSDEESRVSFQCVSSKSTRSRTSLSTNFSVFIRCF